MAYKPKHDYRSKDALERGDSDKKVMGRELSEDFEAISADLKDIHQEITSDSGQIGDIHIQVDANTESIKEINLEIDVIKEDIEELEDSIVWTQGEVDPDTGLGGEIKPKNDNEVQAQAFAGDGAKLTGIMLDQLADVNADPNTNARDDLLIWNGTNWVSDEFAFIQTALRFKGAIAPTADAPDAPEGGDLYVFDAEGTLNASWGALSGVAVTTGKFVGYAADSHNRWYLLGDMADTGIMNLSPGTGIDVDDSKPSEPVISIDRTEVDTWYEPKFSKNTAFNKNFAGSGSADTVSRSDHTHSEYLTDYTETDPTVPPHVKGITQAEIDKWNTSANSTAPVTSVNSKTGAVVLTAADVGAEPAFTKNSAFNKNFGTSSGTVAQGNHTHAYSPTSHDHNGVYEPVITPKNSAFNKNFGTAAGTVAQGNHNHDTVYLKDAPKDGSPYHRQDGGWAKAGGGGGGGTIGIVTSWPNSSSPDWKKPWNASLKLNGVGSLQDMININSGSGYLLNLEFQKTVSSTQNMQCKITVDGKVVKDMTGSTAGDDIIVTFWPPATNALPRTTVPFANGSVPPSFPLRFESSLRVQFAITSGTGGFTLVGQYVLT